MDFIFHGNCFDGALSLALFATAMRIMYKKDQKNFSQNFIDKINQFKNQSEIITKIQNFDYDEELERECEKDEFEELSKNDLTSSDFPDMKSLNIKFHPLKLTQYD